MKRWLPILIFVNAALVFPAVIAAAWVLGIVPEPASWPQDLIVHNNTGQRIKVTPVFVREDGTPCVGLLLPDRKAQRMLARNAASADAETIMRHENEAFIELLRTLKRDKPL